MKPWAQSTLALVALVALVVLGILQAAQLDHLEAEVLRQGQILDQIQKGGVATRQDAAPAAAAAPVGRSEEERAALADPANLLKADTSAPPPGTPVKGGTLRFAIGQDPRGMNVYVANGADLTQYARYINSQLASRQTNDLDRFVPELAIKVTTPDDGLTYLITLRSGVQWHEPAVDWASGRYEWLRGPHPLTSDDFVFVFDMIRNPQVAGRVSALRNYFEGVVAVEKVDDLTFKIVFKERLYSNLPSILGLEPAPRWLYMYDEDGHRYDDATWGLKLNEHWYNNRAIGVGPYRFVSWLPGERIELERNENFWGDTPAFDKVVMLIVKDQNAWPRKLKTGETDAVLLQAEQYRTEVLEAEGPPLGDPHIKVTTYPTLGYYYIGWNLDDPLFQDKRVRQALTLALNREGLVKNVFQSLGEVTSGPFARQHPCYDQSIAPWAFDLQRAAALLDEAGWKDTDGDGIRDRVIDGHKVPFEFTLLIYGSSTEYETLANIYREDLLRVGIRLNPQALEWSTLLKKMDEHEFQAYTGAWVQDWDVDLMQIWHSSEADRPKSSNRIGFRNADADRIAEGLRREFDPQKRTELCHEFHALVHDLQPYTFIYQRERVVAYKDWLNDTFFPLAPPNWDIRYWSFREARP